MMRVLQGATRGVIALLLSVSGILKLVNPEVADTHVLSKSPLLGAMFNVEVRVAVALVECVVAIMLLTRWWRIGMVSALSLTVLFLLFLLTLQLSGIPASSCGCMGSVPLDVHTHSLLLLGVGCASVGSLLRPARHTVGSEVQDPGPS